MLLLTGIFILPSRSQTSYLSRAFVSAVFVAFLMRSREAKTLERVDKEVDVILQVVDFPALPELANANYRVALMLSPKKAVSH